MKMQLESGDFNLISHYGPGEISVNGSGYNSNILITPDRILENWFEGELRELSFEHFAPLLDSQPGGVEQPEIVLLGTGTDHVFPDMKLLVELKQAGLAVEVMNTRAACRTYSVLVGEHRQVAAALLQIR